MFYNFVYRVRRSLIFICNNIFLICASMALTGCVTLLDMYSNHKDVKAYDLENFSSGKKGGVILSFSKKGKLHEDIAFACKKWEQDQVYARDKSIGGINMDFSFITLDPGVYYIDVISLSNREFSNGISKITSNNAKKALVKYGAFIVNPGRISYLGNIEINNFSMQNEYNVSYDMPRVEANLKKANVQHLASLIDTQTLYNPGSVIVEKNGDVNIVSAEEINIKYQNYKN